ncbi:MAG: phosphoglycerate kinase [Rhizobacter sp.]|jgi:probable phosphoglycerate mutase|nr:phosphoglycerate kinase [Rhizobacter sp.]
MTDLILVRHGETDWNKALRFQGQIDVPLNERGHAQARRLGDRLMSEGVQHLYCSDLLRTRQTAEPASIKLALAAVTDASLREQAFGLVEGLTAAEIQERHPGEWTGWSRFDPDYALPGGGESARTFHTRVLGALRALASRHEGQTLAVVTHGGVLDMVYRTAHGLSLHGARDCLIPNAGLNRIQIDGDALTIVSWADDAHVHDL